MCATSEMLNKLYRPKPGLLLKLHFRIQISATAEEVWSVLWNDETYRLWRSVFAEGSYALSDWNEGSRIRFFDGRGNGRFGIIEKNIPFTRMSFKLLGSIESGVERPIDLSLHTWSGATETYLLDEEGSETSLEVFVEVLPQNTIKQRKKFPEALAVIKNLAETRPPFVNRNGHQ